MTAPPALPSPTPGPLATARKWGVLWMVLGIAIVAVAISAISRGLGWSFVLGVIGLGAAALGLRKANDVVRDRCAGAAVRCLVAGVVGVAAGIGVVVLAFVSDSPAIGALGVGVVILGLLPLSSALYHLGHSGSAWWVGGGVGLAAAAVAVHALGLLPLAVTVVAGAAGFLIFRIGIRPFCAPEPPDEARSWRCAVAGGVLILLGAVAIGAAAGLGVALATPGAVAILFGFVTVSIAWPEAELRPLSRGGARLVGAVALLVAVPLLVASSLPFWAWLVAGLFGAALGASLVFRGEGFLLVALVGITVVWVLIPRVDDAPLQPPDVDANERILGLGDSYSSGEGAPEFFAGTNDEGSNECRRTSTAFAYLVAAEMGMGLDFYACSAAKAAEIWEVGQQENSADDVAGKLPQLDNLPEDEQSIAQIKAVLLTIGGNDALFGDITGCAFPGSCAEFRLPWLTNLAQQGPTIEQALRKIKEKVGDDTPVVVLPYSVSVTEEGCGWSPIDEAEHAFMFEFTTTLAEQVRIAAFNAGVNFFEPALFAYEGARVCQGDGHEDAAVNVLNLHPVQGNIVDRLNPANWFHGSIHPKPEGHRLTAALLVPYLEELLASDGPKNPPTRQPPEPTADAEELPERAAYRLPDVLLRPAPVNTSALPVELTCPVGEVSPFGSRMLRLGPVDLDPGDKKEEFVEEQPFALDADPDAPVCYTAPDGSWVNVTGPPGDSVVTITEQRVLERPEDAADVPLADREVLVLPVEPKARPGADPEAEQLQQFVYRRATDGTWRVLEVEFCSLDPDCPTDVNAWRTQQIVTAAQRLSPLAALLVVGGWLLALGFRKAA